jgi:hypothetical protein
LNNVTNPAAPSPVNPPPVAPADSAYEAVRGTNVMLVAADEVNAYEADPNNEPVKLPVYPTDAVTEPVTSNPSVKLMLPVIYDAVSADVANEALSAVGAYEAYEAVRAYDDETPDPPPFIAYEAVRA